ncbi:Qat anti-phage system QueC-like protein QatC [Rhizobium sp. RU20A]|uniref:Qat anti-phage system QueC-like protein QatC n=1 Tax=Rhizobium sp. RU20A TaxID=1907412 RepID=UPI001FCF2787|nr:Qat anti-phage system QueC-like protein QatC [Rhizobium sp. RU20A]
MSELRRQGLNPNPRAWDLLSIALSIITADFAVLRDASPDGWTREIELDVAVSDPAFWNTVAEDLKQALAFLTTDRWKLTFHEGGVLPAPPKKVVMPQEDCVVLLSGGLDSLVGAIDLTRRGLKPVAVSQTVRGDGVKQRDFVQAIGLTKHLQLNHVATSPNVLQETSQRARSLIFLTFGVVMATALEQYAKGKTTPIYVCENGFIAINPPLTGARLGSLSTRTAHPVFLTRLQKVLDAASFNVKIENPYAKKTKGEMLIECKDQILLQTEAAHSTSCGRFQRFNYRHCGRCVPCQVRRAAFVAWDAERDTTDYVYEPLGKDDEDHASFDDVRSVAIALASVKADGLDRWLGHTLSPLDIGDRNGVRGMLDRGLNELGELHRLYGVK